MLGRYFKTESVNKMLDFQFYFLVLLSAHRGIQVLTRLMGHIQTTITHLFCIEKFQTFCSNQNSGCLLSKKLRPHLQILHSKVILKMVNKGHFLAHFQSDSIFWIIRYWHIFYTWFDIVKIDRPMLGRYFTTKSGNRMLDFQFYALLSTYRGNPNFDWINTITHLICIEKVQTLCSN